MWGGMYNELLDSMLARQKAYLPVAEMVSASLVPAPVRKKLSLWMMEICDSFRCEPQVYSCAVTTLDRFLATGKLTRHEEVGVYAAAAIFVACKHSGKYMKAHSLVRFTGNFFSEEQLKAKEMEILSALDWRLDGAAPHDFLDFFVQDITVSLSREDLVQLRSRCELLIDLFFIEPVYATYGPAMIAAAAIFRCLTGNHPRGIAALLPHVPLDQADTCFGIAKHFPTNGEKELLYSCIQKLDVIHALYSSEASHAEPHPTEMFFSPLSSCSGSPVTSPTPANSP